MKANTKATSKVNIIMLLMFFVAMLRSYGKGMGIDCGCFGIGEPLSAKTLVRDGTLVGCSLLLAALSYWPMRAERYNSGPRP